ncbi:hypothetical protein Sjap_006180 [Stephania japonica]|uniref:Auxin-responsive protein n=1 Tax=Stephania japonica TaxID=461633 RepID=A0AAP0K5F6_9MAGN
MEGGLGLIGGGGASSGGSSSTVTKAEVVELDHNMSSGGGGGLSSAEVCSYKNNDRDEAELELGLGLSLVVVVVVVGLQPVGWPPVAAYRYNSLANQTKIPNNESGGNKLAAGSGKGKYEMAKNKETLDSKNKADSIAGKGNCCAGRSLFVKVNMDGVPIGRKVDLSAHASYETLAQMLEDMFSGPTTTIIPICSREKDFGIEGKKVSKLLDGSSDFVLTYEDKDGDWMLVGDVPWGLFLDTVKRLRIMKTSEANGLAARFEDGNERQRKRPI